MGKVDSPPWLASQPHIRAAATVLTLVLRPLCQIDPFLSQVRMAIGKLAFRLLCGAKGNRPNGWWRTFYFLNGLLLVLFAIPRSLMMFAVDALAVAALGIVGGELSAREVCRDVVVDLHRVISDGCPVQNLRMAFGWDG